METILLKIVELLFIQENKITNTQESKSSQTKVYEYVTAMDLRPGSYESNIKVLERVVSVNLPFRDDEVIIVISRLGKGEKPIYHSHRFFTVKQYLSLILKFPENKIVTAIGEPVDGYGLLEFYVSGKKFDVIAVGKNKELNVSEVEEFPHSPFFYLSNPKLKIHKK